MAFLDTCKMSLRVSTTAYDSEINTYINAAKLDLKIAGVVCETSPDDLVNTAIMTYVAWKWAKKESEKEKLRNDYNEQKAQLMNATGYTDWSVD